MMFLILKKLNIIPFFIFLIFSNPIFALDSYELPSGKWCLISLPLDPLESNSVNDVFGDDINANYGTDWLIYGYDPVSNTYQAKEINGTLLHGTGYWILQITGESVQLDMPVNSIESKTVPLIAPTVGDEYQWNLVGHPLSVTKKFSDLKIKTSSGICAVEGCNPVKAKLQKIFQNEVWRMSQGDAEVYEKVSGDTTLNPWDGFWCATLEDANTMGSVVLTANISPLPPITGNWTLSFADDFNGTSLNPNNWRLGEHFLGINGLAANSAKHTIVRNGKLELIAEKTPLRFAGQDYVYSAGEISTFLKHKQLYGYFESRIKYDAVQGVWPAFWTMPDRGNYGNENLRKQSLMRFDLAQISEPVSSATLKVKITDIERPSEGSNITFYKLLTDEWSENSVTWLNRPAYDPAWLRQLTGNQEVTNEITIGQYIEVNVTDYINTQIASNKNASFAIADTFRKQNGITFGSREALNTEDRPRLVVNGIVIFSSADAYVNAGIHENSNFGNKTELGIKEPSKAHHAQMTVAWK